jgi:hypothetical protein
MAADLTFLSSRDDFNSALRHSRFVSLLADQVGQGANLADLVAALERKQPIGRQQLSLILNVLIVERMGYSCSSLNLVRDVRSFDALQTEVARWNRVDLLVAYHHPQVGLTLINPKREAHWRSVAELGRHELVVLHAKGVRIQDAPIEGQALALLRDMLDGGEVPSCPTLSDPAIRATPAPGSDVAEGANADPEPRLTRMTPRYAIQVTNELFHNGNVEAWKNIVESFRVRYPHLDVHVFYDGEEIRHLEALFEWGKVKHGEVLLASVSGENIQGAERLRHYLFEAASPRFRRFVKTDLNRPLELF